MRSEIKIIAALILIIVGCSVANKKAGNRHAQQKTENYLVYKIDSVNSYYLIYARKNDSLFKIVSKKLKTANCKSISIGKNYDFTLRSNSYYRALSGKKILVLTTRSVDCFYYDDSTRICLEGDSITDLYKAINAKGLCPPGL